MKNSIIARAAVLVLTLALATCCFVGIILAGYTGNIGDCDEHAASAICLKNTESAGDNAPAVVALSVEDSAPEDGANSSETAPEDGASSPDSAECTCKLCLFGGGCTMCRICNALVTIAILVITACAVSIILSVIYGLLWIALIAVSLVCVLGCAVLLLILLA